MKKGGDTVCFPAGTYLSFTIRLKSHIGLYLDHGAVILAASHKEHDGGYDPAEPNEWDMYQDHGHSQWQNINGSSTPTRYVTFTLNLGPYGTKFIVVGKVPDKM